MVNETIWRRYPRYLRALEIRTERFNSAPLKDQEKMQPLLPFIERFRLALMAVDDFEKAFEMVISGASRIGASASVGIVAGEGQV